MYTYSRCKYLAIALVLAAAFRPAIEFVLKAVVDRARPTIAPLGEFHGPSHPSGHPLAAASLWGLMPAVVALHFRSRGLWWATVAVSTTMVVVVAAARVYKGAHYLTDVVASLAWAGLYLALRPRDLRPLPPRARLPPPAARGPVQGVSLDRGIRSGGGGCRQPRPGTAMPVS